MAQGAGRPHGSPLSRNGSWSAVAALAIGVTILRGLGCGGEGGDTDDPLDGFDTEGMLLSVATEIIVPTLAAFVSSTEALEVASLDWEQVDPATSDGTARAGAQDAWRAAMTIWQQIEVYQVGPAATSLSAGGGQDLRDAIYSWPTVNTCRVDQELVEAVWDQPNFFDDELVNVYGLDTIEYLLFVDSADNSCPPQIPINEDGSWEGLGQDTIDSRRASYARAASAHVAQVAKQLHAAWDPAEGNFQGEFAFDGGDSAIYAEPREALNALLDALFYVELVVKDVKLARPLGLADCATDTCPDQLESPWADHAIDNLRSNLQAARALLRTGDPPETFGFEPLLDHVGADTLAEDLLAAIDATLAAVDTVPGSALTVLDSDPAPLQAVYDALSSFTDLLKGQLTMALFLEIPQEAASDAD